LTYYKKAHKIILYWNFVSLTNQFKMTVCSPCKLPKEAEMFTKKVWLILLVLVIGFTAVQPVAAAPNLAPVLGTDSPTVIENRYIVVFNPGVAATELDSVISAVSTSAGVAIHYRYDSAIQGFAATLPASAVEQLRRNPNVAYIEADQVMSIDATQSPATWGIDRIDQRNLPLSNSYTYNHDGTGVYAYIIDTGILITHNEFGGRASVGYDAIGDGRNGIDCNGHGTHVAGTVGGSTYGVAKAVSLLAVRVLNCSGSGTTSGVIAGVNWVTANHRDPAVANMSLGGGASSSLDTAVTNSINAGVVYAVAAGNDNKDACRYSPARVPGALTVGATTNTDARASYSNYGSCLDLFAPGSSITSAWYSSTTATNTISGTSMATPHVAGVAALYRDAYPTATVSQVISAIVTNATTGVVGNPGRSSPNRLLYSLLP
jgi:subtilisin family serine protease